MMQLPRAADNNGEESTVDNPEKDLCPSVRPSVRQSVCLGGGVYPALTHLPSFCELNFKLVTQGC